MNKRTKHILTALGILASLGITGFLIYQFVYLPKQEEKEEEEKQKRLEMQKEYEQSPIGNPNDGGYKFNVEGELDYPPLELIGKTLYPKPALLGGLGYAWLRSSAEVDNGGWDFWSNQIIKVPNQKKIGVVTDYKKGNEKGYAYTWYKVEIDKDLDTSKTTGWVRADVVIFYRDQGF